jgi:hypothetical protein
MHNRNSLPAGLLTELSKDLVKNSDSLRSQLSKQALMTFVIVFEHLGR